MKAGARLAGAATAVLVVAAVGTASPRALAADAAPRSSVVYYGPKDPRTTRKLDHRLAFNAEPQDERFWLDFTVDSGNSVFVGQFGPWDPVADLALEGPGQLSAPEARSGISATAVDPIVNTGRDSCPRFVSTRVLYRSELTLPAGSASTVVLTRHLALTRVPTRASLYAQNWTVTPVTDGANPERPVRIAGPLPALLGLKPARLELRAGVTGSGQSITAGQRLDVRARQDLTLSGFLTAADPGSRITIWQYAPTAGKPTRLAVVRVNGHGRFAYRHWRPAATGLYELYATYAGRPGIVESTRSGCGGPKINVGGPGVGRRSPARRGHGR